MTIQDLLNQHKTQLTTIAIENTAQCLSWKPWKTSEIATDSMMCYLENLPELKQFEDEDGYLFDEVLDAICDFSDDVLKAIAPLLDVKAEDLGLYCDL